ncbi:hypothetical protein HYX04_00200 [Candidatus Woesearchaeota archaeon]|nr:hypothetical protein [Candidatus Woesearchaeota archaeon]
MESITINPTDIENCLEDIGWTPLHTRLLAHRIGDGSVNHYGHFDYSNKHINEFIDLANFLRIKFWGPVISDRYGTKKVIIPKKTFRDFASVFRVNNEELVKNPILLLNVIAKLPEEHQLQALLAFIVDDGSCTAWMPVIFEDRNKEVFDKVKDLWDNIFPLTSRIYIQETKKGTKVYHLATNREGVISLILKIEEAVKKYGEFASLWWKQNKFDKRYKIAISERAIDLRETIKNNGHRNGIIFNYLKDKKYLTFTKAQKILNLSVDRTRLVLFKLVNDGKLFLVDAGSKSRYSITYEDVSFENRTKLIIGFIKVNGKIYNRDCREFLNLGSAQSYKILKKIELQGLIKQINRRRGTYYTLT